MTVTWKQLAYAIPTKLPFGADLTIAAGVITVTNSFHNVDTEGGTATDNLDIINAGSEGQVLILSEVNSARVVTVKHLAGNIFLRGAVDFVFDNNWDALILLWYVPTNIWWELCRFRIGASGDYATEAYALQVAQEMAMIL